MANASHRLDDLRRLVAGTITGPDDPGYDDARAVWNARFDHRPAAIVRCASAADVGPVLGFVAERGLPVAVRSGGHDYAGHGACDNGVVIDLAALDDVTIDVKRRRAQVGAGVRWGTFDAAAQVHGLAVPGPTVSTVGVAGSTLGGGSGWLSRRLGLALDNLVAADVVLTSGEQVRASDEEHGDLFWALRGGGGNFGVVTSFEYRLNEVGPGAWGGQVVHRLDDAAGVLRFVSGFMATAPEALQCYPFFYRVPPLDVFPAALHGRPVLALVAAWTGNVAEGSRALAPLRAFGAPAMDTIAQLPYADLQRSFDAGMPAGVRWYSRGHYLDALPDAAIDAVIERIDAMPGPFSIVYFEPLGGAIGRVEPSATAFPHRRAAWGLHVLPGWATADEDGVNIAWARELDRAVAAFVNGGVYVNLLDDDEAARVPAAYGINHDRLVEVKRRYDPHNVLRHNHNIAVP